MRKRKIKSVNRIVLVSSCKGGVGKSTTASNIALALASRNKKVGMMDADIYGPSQALIFGTKGQLGLSESYKIAPIESYNIKVVSMGSMTEETTVMDWRGPMASAMLEQLICDTEWDELDYLVIDLPPGTGDIPLRIAEMLEVHGAVIVTTPQDVALLDVKKGVTMFQKTDTKILGVVENMAMHICSNCSHVEHIFGSGGGEEISKQFGIPLLGSLPLDIRIRQTSDSGKPIMIAEPDGVISETYKKIAAQIDENDV